MGVARLAHIAQMLIEHGKPAQTPAAAVHWATTGRQRTVTAALGDLPAAVQEAGLKAPSLVVIGSVVSLRAELAWFEMRPLLGRGILVTRPRHQAGAMVARLEELGAVVSLLPAVEVREPADWCWSIGAGQPAGLPVARLHQRQRRGRADPPSPADRTRSARLGSLRLAVIGPATADALRRYHLEPDLIPPAYDSESLASALKERAIGQRVLLACADRGRDVLREQLVARGRSRADRRLFPGGRRRARVRGA